MVGKKKKWEKIFVGKNFSHFPKVWSLFTDLFFTAKVIFKGISDEDQINHLCPIKFFSVIIPSNQESTFSLSVNLIFSVC